jgi:hypothetical protein
MWDTMISISESHSQSQSQIPIHIHSDTHTGGNSEWNCRREKNETERNGNDDKSGRTVHSMSETGSTPSNDVCFGGGQKHVIDIHVSECAICSDEGVSHQTQSKVAT